MHRDSRAASPSTAPPATLRRGQGVHRPGLCCQPHGTASPTLPGCCRALGWEPLSPGSGVPPSSVRSSKSSGLPGTTGYPVPQVSPSPRGTQILRTPLYHGVPSSPGPLHHGVPESLRLPSTMGVPKSSGLPCTVAFGALRAPLHHEVPKFLGSPSPWGTQVFGIPAPWGTQFPGAPPPCWYPELRGSTGAGCPRAPHRPLQPQGPGGRSPSTGDWGPDGAHPPSR